MIGHKDPMILEPTRLSIQSFKSSYENNIVNVGMSAARIT